MDIKQYALAEFLGVEVDEIKNDYDNYYNDYNNCYLVVTEEEANELAKEEIERLLFAFNPSFLRYYIDSMADIDYNTFEKVIRSIQSLYENGNEPLKCLIGDNFDQFIQDAIIEDGRENYLALYDGIEHYFYYEDEDFYIYRIN